MPVGVNEESNALWPTKGQADRQTANQNEQIAGLLRQAQIAEPDVLALLRSVWLAVSQTQSEVAWHQQAYLEASQREQELKQQLLTILALLNPGEPSEPRLELLLPLGQSEATLQSGLWQSVRELLAEGLASQRAEAILRLPAGRDLVPPIVPPRDIEAVQAGPGAAGLLIYCLGPFRVYLNGQLVTGWNSLKGQAILKYLAGHHGAPTSKDLLMDLFWPEADAEAARRNLHQAIYCLRQTLKRSQTNLQPILFEDDGYCLDPALTPWLDYAEFERHSQAGRRLETAGQLAAAMAEYSQAEALYQGDFLEDDLYEEWTNWPREHLRNAYLDLADRLSEYLLRQGEIKAAIALCQKMLGHDSCCEQAHRRLMVCFYKRGQRHSALRQYQACVHKLKTELEVSPSVETYKLYEEILADVRGLEKAY